MFNFLKVSRFVLPFVLALPVVTIADDVDVYLLSGQSNMQGIAKLQNAPDSWQQALEQTHFWNGNQFEILDPKTTPISTRAGEFGPELGFVRGLRRGGNQQKLYIVKFHRGGQPLHCGWNGNKWAGPEPAPNRKTFYPGISSSDANIGVHYSNWIKQCRAALAAIKNAGDTPKIEGVVWMQGEQDSKNELSATTYAASLKNLHNRLLDDLNQTDVPLVFGQVLPHEPALDRFTHRSEIRSQMAAVDERSGHVDSSPGIRMVSTDGCPLLEDTVHYSSQGQQRLGLALAATMIDMQNDVPFDLLRDLKEQSVAVETGKFVGYDLHEFKLDGIQCKIACPETPAAGQPWIWRARFWGHQPQFEKAMLDRGWHVCYCDIGNLFGNGDAIKRWDKFYRLSQAIGLHPQPLLEGMSRGGLIVMRWASTNPDRVSGIYLDNAVMDFRSWPGGFGAGLGSPGTWQTCLKAYGITEAQAKKFQDGPLDRLKPLARAGVPIFALINEADPVVPPDENGILLAKRMRRLGSPIIEKRRPGLGHHPHSLKDPTVLIEFAIKSISQTGVGEAVAEPKVAVTQ